jgi:hypothetical protein
VKYILWGVNLQTLQMMLYDAPHYVSGKKTDKKTPPSGKKKNRIAEMYQSRLNGNQ